MENDLPISKNALVGFHFALRSCITSTHLNQWRSFKALKQELEFSAMKTPQLLYSYISNKKVLYQIAASKVRRQLKLFDDNVDAEKFITKLANVIKFWTELPCEHTLKDSNKDLYFIMVIITDSSALGWIG